MKTKTYTKEDFHRLVMQANLKGFGFDELQDHVVVTDMDGVILYANRAAEEKTGYLRAEMIGKTPGEMWGHQMPDQLFRDMWRTIKHEKKPFVGTVKNKRKDGSFYWVELRIYPVLDYYGNVSYFVGIEPDITARVKADEKKNEFMSIVERLRSPLMKSQILLHVLMNEGHNLTPTQKEFLAQAEEVDENLTDLISNLFQVFRIAQGALGLEEKEGSLPALIKRVISDLNNVAEAKRVKFTFRYPKDYVVRAPLELLQQVFEEVIRNAVQYSHVGGQVFVTMIERDAELVVICQDFGIGIPTAEVGRIFDPFYRAANAKFVKEGSGLGLYIAKSVTDILGYRLWISSEEGRGTIARIAIPARVISTVSRASEDHKIK